MLKSPGIEVQACPPLGSFVIYDSFMQHRGTENVTDKPRSTLSMSFSPEGVWMRSYNPINYGVTAWLYNSAYQKHINARLEEIVARDEVERLKARDASRASADSPSGPGSLSRSGYYI